MGITSMVLLACMAGMEARGEPVQKVTVYLRERACLHAEVRISAEALASRMFANIGIALVWAKEGAGGVSLQPPIFIDLATDTPESRMPGALAYALPYEGAHITVFFDRIEKGDNVSTVLAHVMVHEITHLLQGISRHSNGGVMKAKWAGSDYGWMRVAPLPFAQADVDLIYLGLAKRTAVAVAERE